ncbi:site-specific integrase [Verrucomicrobiales bacterium BCK34]|nr:site-specific integrase [Verrucomicrobiales bacterium BCK34]
MLSHAVKKGWIEKNPASNSLLGDRFMTKRKPNKKEQFNGEQLTALFNSPLYTGCKNDGYGVNRPGPNLPRRGKFWVPLIGLFHGMRLNECCQLLVSDIEQEDGIAVIRVSEGDVREGELEKRLKTAASDRTVPLHPKLLRIGFLEFVGERREKGGSERLFPELKACKLGYLSNPFSKWFGKWFGRFLKTNVGEDCGATFHSFRHMVRDKFREIGTNPDRFRAIQGWEEGTGVHKDYGEGFSASVLFDEIRKIEYRGLDLSHLYLENQN